MQVAGFFLPCQALFLQRTIIAGGQRPVRQRFVSFVAPCFTSREQIFIAQVLDSVAVLQGDYINVSLFH